MEGVLEMQFGRDEVVISMLLCFASAVASVCHTKAPPCFCSPGLVEFISTYVVARVACHQCAWNFEVSSNC